MVNNMADKPLITVSAMIYNNIEGLEQTVNSFMEQDYENAEIILSDDGSTKYDTSVLNDYADRLRQKYKKVLVNVNEQNMGTVKHINKVIKLSSGKYYMDCSSGDVFYKKDTVSKIVEFFETHDELVLTTKRVDRYEDGTDKIRPTSFVGFALKYQPKRLLDYILHKKNVISGSCTFYKKEIFEKYGYYDEQYFLVEDYPYFVHLLENNVKFGWMSEPTVIHEMGGVSTGDVHPGVYKDIELLRKNYGIE